MFELPEIITLAHQIKTTLKGKVISEGRLGNSPHKFVWYNRTPEEFSYLCQEKTIGAAQARGRWLFIPIDPGYVFLLGECGGKMLYHQAGTKVPAKYHAYLAFEDGSFFTVMTQMWGAMELYEAGLEMDREYVKDMRPTPVDPQFTFAYFDDLLDQAATGKARSVKSLLTQEQTIPGLGNAIAQDIQFQARLDPRHPIKELSAGQREDLYSAVTNTVQEIIAQGGRYDETDLFGRPGGYVRLMDKNAVGRPCPRCAGEVIKINYLGGACYCCSNCQN